MNMKLEVVIIPVSDVDRAKAFYEKVGFDWISISAIKTSALYNALLLVQRRRSFSARELRPPTPAQRSWFSRWTTSRLRGAI